MRRKSPPRPTRQILLFPPAGRELRVELAAPQQRELIRALAELLLRERVVAYGRVAPERTTLTPQAAGSEGTKVKSGWRAWSGAALMHRAFAIDVLACPHCGGRLRLIATLHEPAVIRKLLAHLGMARSGPSPGPAPPESGGIAS
jgi:hypothetical protein